MILRPVTPVSPIGPPMTNRPVGLMKILVFLSTSRFGSAFAMTSSRIAAWSLRFETLSACCVETTTVSIRATLPPLYSTVTWLLPSGRRKSSPARRAFASWRVTACAYWIGAGMSSVVSSQAYPNIIPWSPAPPVSTPWPMSLDCWSTATSTPQVFPSKPISPST